MSKARVAIFQSDNKKRPIVFSVWHLIDGEWRSIVQKMSYKDDVSTDADVQYYTDGVLQEYKE